MTWDSRLVEAGIWTCFQLENENYPSNTQLVKWRPCDRKWANGTFRWALSFAKIYHEVWYYHFPYYWTPSICMVGSWALAIHAMWHLRREPLESRNSEQLIGIHLQFLGSPSEYHVLPCHHNKPSFLLGFSAQKWLHVIVRTDIIPGLVNDLALRWFNGRPKPLKKAEPESTIALLKGLQLSSLISWFVLDEIGPFAHGTFWRGQFLVIAWKDSWSCFKLSFCLADV